MSSIEEVIDTLARTLWAEARGEGTRGMHAVANVVMNRVAARRWANDVIGVIKQPRQFSPWTRTDPQHSRMLAVTVADPQFREAQAIAMKAVLGDLEDITGGADHFHTRTVSPAWSRGRTPVAEIGRHVFFRLA